MRRNYLHAYAIVRFESDWDSSVPIEGRITVKKVVFDPDYAQDEVQRLNELKEGTGTVYFSQITRIEQPLTRAELRDRLIALSNKIEMQENWAELERAEIAEHGEMESDSGEDDAP